MKGKTEYSFADVLDILTAEQSPQRLCHRQPMRCRQNMTFLINTTNVKVQDLPFDDNGRYIRSGSHTCRHTKLLEEILTQQSFIAGNEVGGTQFIYLRRLYRTSKASPYFRQIVSYLEDVKENIINNTALLQYIFKGEEHPFEVQPHGNRKTSSGPFLLPTNKTTKAQIRDELKKNQTKKGTL